MVIPAHLRKLAGRSEFKHSLKTKDFTIALEKYRGVDKYYQQQLEKLRAGENLTQTKETTHAELVELAKLKGHEFHPLSDLLDNPNKFMETVNKWKKAGSPHGQEIKPYFADVSPSIKLSELVEFYERDKIHVLTALTKRERDKKLNPLKNAVNQLLAFLGQDLTVQSLTREQARGFHRNLKTRIASEEIAANTASKYITHLRVLIKTYNDAHDIEDDTVFAKLNFMAQDKSRPPFSVEFLNERWFKKDVFSNLHPCAKALLFAVVDTGCSFKELCGLDPAVDIKLNAPVPHIIIQDNKLGGVKTVHRKRTIPLIGYSLKVFQAFPMGFTHYATGNGPSNASGLVNKYLQNNGLTETADHTVYSLRHSFKDRMRIHRIPDELQHYLMGHKDHGMGAHYGQGYSIKDSAALLQQLERDWKYISKSA